MNWTPLSAWAARWYRVISILGRCLARPGKYLNPHRKALMDRLAAAPDDIATRAALYRDLLDTADIALDGLRVAAGLGDPAALALVAELKARPHANRPRAWLLQLRGLPVDRLELSDAEPDWLNALAGLPLRTLVLDSPNFSCDQELWRRLPALALETLEISGFARTWATVRCRHCR